MNKFYLNPFEKKTMLNVLVNSLKKLELSKFGETNNEAIKSDHPVCRSARLHVL